MSSKIKSNSIFLIPSMRFERLKAKDFWETFSTDLADDDFRRYYRMDRATFRALTSYLNPKTRKYQGGRVQVLPHKQVGMTLCFLGSRMTYHQLAGIFGISEECFIRTTNYVMQLLNDHCRDLIKWPRKEDYLSISENFNKKKKRQFPNIVGAIDGCHIRIAPRRNEIQTHRNFKNFHSIHLQAVCLNYRKFTDIFVG